MRLSTLFTVVVLLAAFSLGGCGPSDDGTQEPDAARDADGSRPDVGDAGDIGDVGGDGGCSAPRHLCQSACCDEAERCLSDGTCCLPACAGRQCGDDGCGGSCGTCTQGDCGSDGKCTCVPKTEEELCVAEDYCGTLTVDDGCGAQKQITCRTCDAGQRCSSTTNRCTQCDPISDEEFCQAEEAVCGPLSGKDECGIAHNVTSCGSCPKYNICVDSRCTTCDALSDEELCEAADKECGAVMATDPCGEFFEADCGDCPSGKSCDLDHQCVDTVELMERSCGAAEQLNFTTNGRSLFTVDTSLALDLHAPPCLGKSLTGGGDIPYTFTLPHAAQVTFTATPLAPQVVPTLSLTTSCGVEAPNLACLSYDPVRHLGGALSLTFDRLEAGVDYILWVDSATAEGAGPMRIELMLEEPAETPENDRCGGAIPLEFDSSNRAFQAGTTRGASDDGALVCSPPEDSMRVYNGADVFYSFDVDDGHEVGLWARAQSTALSPEGELVLFHATGCPLPSSTECARESIPDGAPRESGAFVAPKLGPGRHYLVVKATNGGHATFELEVRLTEVIENFSCEKAKELVLDPVTLRAKRLLTDLKHAPFSTSSSCKKDNTGGDIVFHFTVPPGGPKRAQVRVTPADGSFVQPSVSIRAACGERTREVGCDFVEASTPLDARMPALTPGDYWLWIDSSNKTTNDPTHGDAQVFWSGAFWLDFALAEAASAASNDTCADAIDLGLTASKRSVTITGSTYDASQDRLPSQIAAINGPDIVYTFLLETPALVTASVEPTEVGHYVPALLLRSRCVGEQTEDERAYAFLVGGKISFSHEITKPGRYYLLVGGTHYSEGSFTLDVSVLDKPNNLSCSAARPINFEQDGTAQVISDTSFGVKLTESGCNTGTGKELYFSVTIPEGGQSDLSISVEPLASSPFAPVVSLRRTCGDVRTEVSCDSKSTAIPSVQTIRWLSPGTYGLIVDGSSASGKDGPFRMNLALSEPGTPATNAACAPFGTPRELSLTGEAIQGDTRLGLPETDGSCGSRSGAELIYSFSIDDGYKVTFTATPDTSGTQTLLPVLYVRRACDLPYSERRCVKGTASPTTTLTLTDPGAGTYLLFVDSASRQSEGSFSLTALLEATTPVTRPANDLCVGALPISFSAGERSKSVSGLTTAQAHDDYAGRCENLSALMNGGETVYKLSFAEAGRLTARLARRATSPTYNPALYIRNGNCASTAAADELGCGIGAGGIATATATVVQGATYYLFADGMNLSGGEADLELTLSPTLTLPDSCAAAQAITDQGLSGDGADFRFDSSTTASRDHGQSSQLEKGAGKDLVYRLELAGTWDVTAELAFTSMSDIALLYLRSSCDSVALSDELATAQAANGGPARLRLRSLAPGTYWLWVDAGPYLEGDFALNVELSVPVDAEAGSCATAIPLTLDSGTLRAAASGTLYGAPDHDGGSCGAMTGGERVYSFTIDAQHAGKRLTAKAVRDSAAPNFIPALYLRRAEDCESFEPLDELGCAAGVNGTAALSVNRVEPGDYSLFVDGLDGTGDAFALELSLGSPVDKPDKCSDAQPILFDDEGRATLAGTLTDTVADLPYTPSCGAIRPDVVYSIDTRTLGIRDLEVSHTLSALNVKPTLMLQRLCGSSNPGDEVACPSSATGKTTQLGVKALPPGKYFLWVGAASTSPAPRGYLLEAKLSPPLPPQGNLDCATPSALEFDQYGEALVVGDTTGSTATSADGCGAIAGPKSYYFFQLAEEGMVSIAVERSATNPTFSPAFALLPSSCAGSSLLCSTSTNGVALASSPLLEAGTTYIVAVGAAAEAGRFSLRVRRLTSSSSSCSGASALRPIETYSANGAMVGRVFGTTEGALDAGVSTCSGANAGFDVAYRLNLAAKSAVSLTLTPAVGANTISATVSLRSESGCTTDATDLACNGIIFFGSSIARAIDLAAGNYYVWIHTKSATVGTFALDVKVESDRPAPENNECATPDSLGTAVGGTAAFSRTGQDLSWARSNYAATAGGELYYSFTTDSAAYFSVKVLPSRDLFPIVRLAKAVCPVTTEITAASPVGEGEISKIDLFDYKTKLEASTTYLLIVEAGQSSIRGTLGTFDLELSLFQADSCPGTPVIWDENGRASFTAQSRRLALASYTGSCGTMNGTERAFQVAVDEAKSLQFRVTAPATGVKGNFSPTIYVRKSCATSGAANEVLCVTANGASQFLSTPALAAGTYYLFIDSASAPTGETLFDLELAQVTPGSLPANDTCAAPTALQKDVPLYGDTRAAMNDYTVYPSSNIGPGRDLVFSFAPGTTSPFKVTVTTLTAFAPSIFVFKNTCPTTSLATSKTSSNETSGQVLATNNITPTAATDVFYIVVDSMFGASAGEFQLLVQ